MSSTTPGSEPDRDQVDGDAGHDATTDAGAGTEPEPETGTAPGRPEAKPADEADAPAGTEPLAASPADADAHDTGRDVPADTAWEADSAREPSELDAAVERARTEHPPVEDETAVPAETAVAAETAAEADAEEHPEPVRADEVRRETFVPPMAEEATPTAPAPPAPPAPQTVYVQAPAPPRERGNRGFGVLVGLIATVAFAALYAGASYLVILGQHGSADAGRIFVQFTGQAVFWVPVVLFLLGFALLAAILNRSAWWTWAVFGLAVGVIVYFAYIGGALLTVQAWNFTPSEAAQFIRERWLDPYAIIAFIVAREMPIWFGGWIASHGRTVTDRNIREREEYDRMIAEGPQPVTRTH
ncbi:hypothetical protein [Agromyces marinus]|uniref:ABC transporter n=1 Tax=Agromyces marinus TaxID=1389020 RepID=A0ABM8H3V4_9MICO|nr:hypothetical protein [Agromyces marinus]UIP59467.1 hypothetical protein DSM26151_23740 [Agromyces marinus]BDZ55487.1 hypothetical protein GCM10025870_25600 [Agromyces marinus]